MRADIYVKPGCSTCTRIKAYLEHRYGDNVKAHDIDAVFAGDDAMLKAQVLADLGYQLDYYPVTYIDGEYQEYAEIMGQVKAWEIAQRYEADHSKHDFILGEEVTVHG